MARGLDLLAIIAARRGDPVVAARRFGTAAAARVRLAARQWRTDRSRFAPLVEAARAAAGADAFDAAWQEGCRLALDAAVDEVLAEEPLPGAAATELAPRAREASATPSLVVRMLGPLEIVRDGAPLAGDARRHAKSRELLLFLLLHPEGRTREQIGLAFWPDASAAQVKNNFHVTLHHLRRALGGAHWFVFEHDRYRIDPAVEVTMDARTFERGVREAVRASDPLGDEAIARLRGALAAYRGDLLEGESLGDWHLDAHDRLRRVWADGMGALGERLARSERWGEAAAVYRDLVAREELDEGAHRRLMTCLSRAGERAAAMRAYERLASRLAAELDTVPERETTALYDRLRRAESL
jgi:DNA-binding SARP family transcriptional activator